MTKVRLPRLLDDNMNEVRRIEPIDGSLSLSIIPLSTASLTLSSEQMIPVRSWVEMYNALGSVGIYRVRTAGNTYGSESSVVELDHAIVELGDFVCDAELNKSEPLNQAIAELFTFYKGNKWSLGAVQFTDDVVLDIAYESVLEGLLGLLRQVPEYVLSFDFSVTPWVVNVIRRGTVVSAEGRLSRNIQEASVSYDDSELCTRVYIEIDEGDGQTSIEHYDSDTIGTYGVIEKYISGSYDAQQAPIVARSYLNSYKKPIVAISITGYDFYISTGEDLDRLELGKLYRLALPKYGVTVEENITGLDWGHLYSNPNDVEISLADVEDPVVAFVRKTQKSVSRASSAIIKHNKEYWTKFDQTDYYIDQTAAHANDNGDILQQAGMYLDAQHVLVYALDNENNIGSKLKVLSDEISSSVSSATSTFYSEIQQTASSITATIADTESDLYNFIQNTASGTRQIIHSTTNQTWIQDKDPTTSAGGSHNPKTGDVWVESTHQGTWDGADGFDWEHDEDFDWNQIQGAKVWGWANDKWELVSDQQQVVTYADVVNTAEHYISLRIKGIVNDEGMLEVYLSKLEQTATELRSDIYHASSDIYSFIDQTASSINMGVGARPTTVRQTEQPTKISGRNPKDNDIWIKTQHQESWDKALNFSWNDDYEIDWNELRSDQIYIYQDGEWVLAMDGTVLTEDTDLQIEKSHIALLARNIDTLDGYARENFAQLKVEASRISSTVLDKTNELGSRITQTATQIRSEVHASQSTVYSEIVQTASHIYLHVADEVNGLNSSLTVTASAIRTEVKNSISKVQSSITQTANSIRSDVSAANSRIYSNIIQTASSIRSEVNNSISSVRSSITQTANSIRSDVSAANSRIYSNIVQTASAIRLEVKNSISGVNSSITQTASSIRSEVAATNSSIRSSITQTASAIRSEVAATNSSIRSSITQTANSIRSDVSAANSTIYTYIKQTASQIRLEVAETESGLKSSIDVQKNRINLVVSGSGSNATIKAASIVTAVNDAGSSVAINADHIYIEGTTKLSGQVGISNGSLLVKTALIVSGSTNGNVTVNNGTINCKTHQVNTGGSVKWVGTESGEHYDITASVLKGMVKSFKVSGNTLTLTPFYGDSVNFSKAITSWTLSGSDGKINVKANPQNQTKKVPLSISGPNSITTSGTKTYAIYYEDDNGDDQEISGTGFNVSVAATAYEYYNTDIINQRTGADRFWKPPAENGGVCTIPNAANTAAVTWFTMNPMTIRRVQAGRDSSGHDIYYGDLFYYDADAEDYVKCYSGGKQYWYRSSTNLANNNAHTMYYT